MVPDAATALKEIEGKKKGARRAWEGNFGGKTFYCVAFNEDQACLLFYPHIGGEYHEIGKQPRAPRAPKTAADLIDLIAGMAVTPEQKAELLKKVQGLQTAS
jgi:hypothetical protein